MAALAVWLVACGGETAIPDAGVDSGASCTNGAPCGVNGTCVDGTCVEPVCGNATLETGEQCDDGNDEAFDGCEATCTFSCGAHADCDDGNPCNGAETCPETLHYCSAGEPADGATCDTATVAGTCVSGRCLGPGCGNGVVATDEGEACDDGANGDDLDGCTDDCVFTCSIWPGQTNVLGAVNGGFETGSEYVRGVSWPDPIRPVWFGDAAEMIGAQAGISPASGASMLHFMNASGGPSPAAGAQAWFVIDLAPWANEVATGRLRAHLGAQFNRVSGGATTDTGFNVALYAHDSAQVQLSRDLGATLVSDAIPDTWECAHSNLLLPSNAAYLAVELKAQENVQNDVTDPEFDGHYADVVELWLVMDP